MSVGTQSGREVLNRTQRRASRTRKRLLDAAMAMFREKGVDATTIEDITERADVGKGTFYRHFANKEAVVVALAEDVLAGLMEQIRASERPGRTLEGVLEDLVQVHVRFFAEHPDEFVLLFRGRMLMKLRRNEPVTVEEPLVGYLDEIQHQVVPHVAPPVDPGKVRRLAYALAGFVSGFFSFATLGIGSDEIERTLGPLRHAFVAGASAFLKR